MQEPDTLICNQVELLPILGSTTRSIGERRKCIESLWRRVLVVGMCVALCCSVAAPANRPLRGILRRPNAGLSMLNIQDFKLHCLRLGLSHRTQDLIARIRTSDPARSVLGGSPFSNVAGSFPSRKMGIGIQFESHTVELYRIYLHEHDPRVLEYWDQPKYTPAVEVVGKNGRVAKRSLTPDLFVLGTEEAGWTEEKDEAEYLLLPTKMPELYSFDKDGMVRCLPGEAMAAKFGLYYRVNSSGTIPPNLARNYVYLDDYFRTSLELAPDLSSRVEEIVNNHVCIALSALFEEAKSFATRDDIQLMVTRQVLHVDLASAPLVEPDRVMVFHSLEARDAYSASTISRPPAGLIKYGPETPIIFNGREWIIVNVGSSFVCIRNNAGDVTEIPIRGFDDLILNGRISLHHPPPKAVLKHWCSFDRRARKI